MASTILAYILNNAFMLSAMFVITFRKLILKVWIETVDLLCLTWHAIVSVLYLCVVSFVIMSKAAGSQGGYFVSEYVAEHVTPMVLIAIFAFAQLFLQVTNLYSVAKMRLNRAEYYRVSDAVIKFRNLFSAFISPTPVLLQ